MTNKQPGEYFFELILYLPNFQVFWLSSLKYTQTIQASTVLPAKASEPPIEHEIHTISPSNFANIPGIKRLIKNISSIKHRACVNDLID